MPGDGGDYRDARERTMEDPNKQASDGKNQESQQETVREKEKEAKVNDSEQEEQKEQDEVDTSSSGGEKDLRPGEETPEDDDVSESDQSKPVSERNKINHTLRPGEEES